LNTCYFSYAQIKNGSIEIITTDIENFWRAYDIAAPNFDAQVFQKNYFDIGSPALKDFIKYSIKNADELSKTILKRPKYYASIRESVLKINSLKPNIEKVYLNFQKIYPEIYFPKLYFVIGRMSSGGTGSKNGLIIGAEMYGLTNNTPKDELNDWLKSVLKSVDEIPHIVAHELVHEFQTYDGGSLLAASIKEGGADYIAELISGKHINQNVHNYANPKERELWLEFKKIMLKNDYTGWLYSQAGDRPQDLGYWMGYKITKSYFDNSKDKKQAMQDFLNIKDFEKFLVDSRYETF
jgi:hypothetical protein